MSLRRCNYWSNGICCQLEVSLISKPSQSYLCPTPSGVLMLPELKSEDDSTKDGWDGTTGKVVKG